MTHYKLVYFDIRGLGECIRLFFHYVNQKFEDCRLSHENFLQIKKDLKYGQVPYLEVDNKRLYQSITILRFLAESWGLVGVNKWERAKINEIADFHKDVMNQLSPYTYVVMKIREGNQNKLREEVFLPKSKQFFPIYEKIIADSPSGFLISSGLSFVDFYVAETFNQWITLVEPSIAFQYPIIADYVKRFFALEPLQSYLAKKS